MNRCKTESVAYITIHFVVSFFEPKQSFWSNNYLIIILKRVREIERKSGVYEFFKNSAKMRRLEILRLNLENLRDDIYSHFIFTESQQNELPTELLENSGKSLKVYEVSYNSGGIHDCAACPPSTIVSHKNRFSGE